MSRRGSRAIARARKVDARYESEIVSLMINMVMREGKKQLACGIVWQALERFANHEISQKVLDANTSDPSDNEQEGGESEGVDVSVVLDDKARMRNLIALLIEKAGPEVELKSKRLGGANIQAPVAVRSARRVTLALRSIIKNARNRISQSKSMISALSLEMIDVMKGSAKTLDDKEQLLRMAKANAVFQGSRRG